MNLNDHRFFHVIDLPDGRVTPGVTDHRDQPALLGIDRPGLLEGRRVLDIGANDGYWAFWAERAGAKDVLAIDVESCRDYDWGFDGPPAEIAQSKQPDKRKAFDALRAELQSRVRRERKTVYDLSPETDGIFDLIVFYGVLYHLRHPLLALDRLRRVCRGCVLVQTQVAAIDDKPSSLFFWDDVFHGHTNWCGPSEACVVAWMRSAGFTSIFRERMDGPQAVRSQRFIGTVTPEWHAVFESNQRFALADDAYFARFRAATHARLFSAE